MCVMKIPVATVLILLVTSPPSQSKKYDDDISPGKVNLEDIEDSHIRAEKKLQHQLQKTKPHNIPTKPPNLNPPTFSTQHKPNDFALDLPKTTPSHINNKLASQRVQPLDRSSSTFVHSHSHRRPSDYEISAAQHNSIGVPSLSSYDQFVHSDNNEGDTREAINENELQQQQQQQQQPVFAYSHDESQFADANSYQRQQQQQQHQDYIQSLPQYDQNAISNNRQHQRQQQKESYVMTPSAAPPPARLPPRSPATSVITYPIDAEKGDGSDGDSGAFHQQPPQQPHTPYLQYGPPGIQYLTSNVIHAMTLLNPVRGMSVIEYSHERGNSNDDKHQAIEYGNPEVVFRRPQYGQSNQQVYAPKRPTQSNNYNTVPFPPSFISITTERPNVYVQSTRAADYADTANEWQMNVIPLQLAVRPQNTNSAIPDIFAGRQAKSLLDSYIPSWLVTKMQELNIRPYLPLSNQIPDVDYDYSNSFKRSTTTTTRHKQKKSATNSAEELMVTS